MVLRGTGSHDSGGREVPASPSAHWRTCKVSGEGLTTVEADGTPGLNLPFRPHVGWMMPTQVCKGDLHPFSSGNTVRDTPRGNVLPGSWASLSPVKSTWERRVLSSSITGTLFCMGQVPTDTHLNSSRNREHSSEGPTSLPQPCALVPGGAERVGSASLHPAEGLAGLTDRFTFTFPIPPWKTKVWQISDLHLEFLLKISVSSFSYMRDSLKSIVNQTPPFGYR